MIYYLTNPKHGVMVVYSDGDAVKHEALGWTKHASSDAAHAYMKSIRSKPVTEIQFTPEPTIIEVSRLPDVKVTSEVVKRKPGRPKKV